MANSTPSEPAYIPGQCNLGPMEVHRRYRMGYIGLGLTFLLIAFILMYDPPRYARLFLFFTSFYALSGFLQARKRFCFVYGWKGLYNLGNKKHHVSVKQKDSKQADQTTALKMVALILVLSTLFAALFYFM